MPVYVTDHSGNVYKDATVFEKCYLISLSQWCDKWHERFFIGSVKLLMPLSKSTLGLMVEK